MIIEDEVFASRRDRLALAAVIHLGFEGQHRVQTDPPYDPAADRMVNRWLNGLDQIGREEAELALEAGMERDALGPPADLSPIIADIHNPVWDASPLRLPPAVALRFLQQPLRVVLEDRHNDGAFLRRVPPSPWRQELQKSLSRKWIEFDHGGGSSMKTRLETASREEALRLWALFDSDAREPECPSEEAEIKRRTCLSRGIAHHQLQRREIENYLPPQALQAWAAKSPGNLRASRRRKADAFAGLQPEQRRHFNMKDGFAGDRKHRSGIPAFFDSCSTHRDLQTGFGGDITSLFHEEDFPLREEWLRRDGQHPETLAMVQSILRRL